MRDDGLEQQTRFEVSVIHQQRVCRSYARLPDAFKEQPPQRGWILCSAMV